MTEPIFFRGDHPGATISRWMHQGRAQRIAPGVYATDVRSPPEHVVARHWRTIVGHELPEAVLVDRSAVRNRPSDGFLFVDVGPIGRRSPLRLPGLTVMTRCGPGPLDGDVRDASGIWLSSQGRALADNTRHTRARSPRPAATLTDDELADWLDHLAAQHGVDGLLRLRADAEQLAPATDTTATIRRVSDLIGGAVGTRPVTTGSRRLRSRQAGLPFDAQRATLFESLANHLRGLAPTFIPEAAPERRALLPFYEAYFSNFIEGTVLDLDDAEAVVFDGVVLDAQPEDSHDVSATFALVSDEIEMRRVPATSSDFEAILLDRHERLMAARPTKHPGRFKAIGNRAGAATFVAPDAVRGTLHVGWEQIDSLDDPYHRAVLTMFVVAEVHPFDDGNGRLARIMMNAALSAGGEARIIVPSVYRSEYLSSLAALTLDQRPTALERVLAFAQRWTSQIDWSDRTTADRHLTATHAFVDPGVAMADGIKLRLLSSVPADELSATTAAGVEHTRALGVLDAVVKATDPYETPFGRARADQMLPQRVRR